MLTNRKPREHVQHIEYTYEVERKKGDGGFSWPCDADGNLDAATAVRRDDLVATGSYFDNGVIKYERWHHIPGSGRCPCGRTVDLCGFTNACECGRDYNMSGDELADRSQWGEETGESVSDILMADSSDSDAPRGMY